ncbi:hypothetical protein ABIA48_003088 [Pseudomonas sp. S30_BP2TU TE3576]|uniref:hypothetical protein n=1 Tax=Pseudomonas sp. S30_BP2TU TE3576 TaxID=3349329 RepID=UPI003D1E0162
MKGLVMLLLLWAFVRPAFAEDDCTMRLSPAMLDYGSLTRARLLDLPDTGGALSFGLRRIRLQIQCPEERPMGLRFNAPAADAQGFRFGSGTVQLRLVSSRLDGRSVDWVRDVEQGRSTDRMWPGVRVRPRHNGKILSGEHLEVELELDARIDRQAARVSDMTLFQLAGSFQLD